MKTEKYISYLKAKKSWDSFSKNEIQLLLSVEKQLNINLDNYIPFDGNYEKTVLLTSKMPKEMQWNERIQFAINRYMRYRLEVG